MTTDAHGMVEQLFAALGGGDLGSIGALYAPDAELVRYDGAATGTDEIIGFYSPITATTTSTTSSSSGPSTTW